MVNKGEARRAQRVWLFHEQRGRCFWCGAQMVMPDPVRHQPHPPNEATIDHLESRLSEERGQFGGQFRHVLACRKCNGERAGAEVAALPREELWRRSGRSPGGSTGGGFTAPLQHEGRRRAEQMAVPLGLAARITGDYCKIAKLLTSQSKQHMVTKHPGEVVPA